ncbi:MAG: hypothetical protein ACRD2I_25480 [Vicinamibacterales bacterium]
MSIPPILTVTTARMAEDPGLATLVRESREQADAFIFLSGGASGMSSATEDALLHMFESLAILAARGVRFGVADGGTAAGIMQAAGRARARASPSFPLIGVTPMREIPPFGTTPVDPNHTTIVAVDNPHWDGANGYFGSETVAMYGLFARLAEGRPSVTIVANGGEIALTEVDQNIRAGRPMIVVRGSGRAADTLGSMLDQTPVSGDEIVKLRAKAEALHLLRQADLFHVFDLARGPQALAGTLGALLCR